MNFFLWGHNIYCNVAHFALYIFFFWALCCAFFIIIFFGYVATYVFFFLSILFFLWGRCFGRHRLNLGFTLCQIAI
jgi:hypothetical protein